MNWAPLILAAVFATPAVVMLLHKKAPRLAAILSGIAALCILAGVPSFLAEIGHPLAPGPILLFIVVAARRLRDVLLLRRDPRSPQGLPDGPQGHRRRSRRRGAAEANHHVRPLVATVGLAVFGLMVAMNFSAVTQGLGSGFSQTYSTITHQRGA